MGQTDLSLDWHEAIAEARRRLPIAELWAKLGLEGAPTGRRRAVKSPFREERSPSFSISACGGLWKDFGSDDAGDAVTFVERALGLSRADAMRRLMVLAGVPVPGGRTELRGEVARVVPVVRVEPLRRRPVPDLSEWHRGTPEQWARLAALRRLPLAAVEAMVERGMCLFGLWCGRESWAVTDRKRVNAQARRLDGGKWRTESGEVKSLTLRNSWAGWPLGLDEVRGDVIHLVEGGPDLLAAFSVLERGEPVGMLGASLSFYPSSLIRFAGKRVNIIPHNDAAGAKASYRWREELRPHAASVHIWKLPSTVKDLNEYLQK